MKGTVLVLFTSFMGGMRTEKRGNKVCHNFSGSAYGQSRLPTGTVNMNVSHE